MITKSIAELVNYGIAAGLVDEEDKIYTTNRLLELFGIEEYEEPVKLERIPNPAGFDLEALLKELLDYAVEKGLLSDDSIVYRDLFDTKIMGALVPRPSDVIFTFRKLYEEKGPKAATDWYYAFSQNTDYIRRYRIARDMKWKAQTAYGEMDITINLSKPEKDPKAIAAAKMQSRVDIPNVSSVWKMKAMLAESIIRQDKIIELYLSKFRETNGDFNILHMYITMSTALFLTASIFL